MRYLRRAMPLALSIAALAPGVAHATVTCNPQQAVPAWAGSPKTVSLDPGCTTDVVPGHVTYAIATNGTHGTATVPDQTGKFIYTATFNPNGADFVGADVLHMTASDGGPSSTPFDVTISVGDAPLLGGNIDAATLKVDAPFQGTPVFEVLYKDPVTLSATLKEAQPPSTPLGGFAVRFQGIPAGPKTLTTNAGGAVGLVFRPLISDFVSLDVPSLPGVFSAPAILLVAPDWSIPSRVPVRHRKFVVAGRLRAEKSARTGGTLTFQRRKGTKWLTVTRKVKLSASLRFTVKLSTKYSGVRLRLLYKAKATSDYINSEFRFKLRKKKRSTGRVAVRSVRASHSVRSLRMLRR